MKKPAETVTLSSAEGEAMIARLSVYAPSRSDCEILIQVVRWYFWRFCRKFSFGTHLEYDLPLR